MPQVSVSSTESQGGKCEGRRTLDLILTFKVEPKEWTDLTTLPEGPCNVIARPLDTGEFEMRFSYPGKGKEEMSFLPFISTQRFIVDHWIVSAKAKAVKLKKKPRRPDPDDSPSLGAKVKDEMPSAKVEVTELANSFENQSSWEKMLGTAAAAMDFNSPELDRFRQKDLERNLGLPSEPIERRPLRPPPLDLPQLENQLNFAEEKISFNSKFKVPSAEHGDVKHERSLKAVEEGMNFVRILVSKGEWLKAHKAIDVLERSAHADLIPSTDPAWWTLKGLVYMKIGRELKNPALVKRALQVWRDGLRKSEGWGGSYQDYIEFMALESVRNLFNENLVYAAASLLNWVRRYSWSAATEERFSFLRGESYYQLGLFEDAKNVFEEFVNSRIDIPVSSFADRRLISAAAFRLGDLQLRLENSKEAVAAYTKAFVEGPKARKFSFEGNWYSDDVQVFPYVLFNRAEAYFRLGQEDSALRDLRAFLFAAPAEPEAGLVYYRIGDILESLGAPDDKIYGAWNECVFKVPKTLGGRLCNARKASKEMTKLGSVKRWPRLIADIEDSLAETREDSPVRLRYEELKVYLNILIADSFLRAQQPYQALLRLDPLQTEEVSANMRGWLREYLIASLAGYEDRLVREKKYREIIADYQKREKVLFLGQTRHEILWNVVRAYHGLDLLDEALKTIDAAEKVRERIARKSLRPFEPADEEWISLRASILMGLLEKHRPGIDVQKVQPLLDSLDASKGTNQRLWVRFLQVTGNKTEEVAWWAKIEQTEGLSWSEVGYVADSLQVIKRKSARRDLLERRVGSWFGEKDKIASASPPPSSLLMELFDTRVDSGDHARALPIADYLTQLSDEKLGTLVTKPMIAYKKGKILQELGRLGEARQSFERAKQMSPDSIWGKLSSSAQKEMNAAKASGTL